MFVKICGITNREDALAAVDAGARALGFIFYPASPRHVTAAQLEPWVNEIPAEIWKVGVFVDEMPDEIERIAVHVGLDIAQLHGCETPDRHPWMGSPGLEERVQGNPLTMGAAARVNLSGIRLSMPARPWSGGAPYLRIWKAFRVRDSRTAVLDYPEAEAILIDGEAYDWTRTAHFTRPLILAGGLDEYNVRDRIQRAEPWGVDVASGIESSPGRKDHARMKRFIEAALRS